MEHSSSKKHSESLNSRRRLVAIAAIAGVLLVGGIGVAVAQTGGSSTTTPSTTVPGPGGPGDRGAPGGPGGPGGRHGRGGPGFGPEAGPRGAIHGEFVAPDGS